MDKNPIKHRRKTAGLTQGELAAFLGVSPGLIGFWERGEALPGQEVATELGRAFNVPAVRLRDELVAFQEKQKRQATKKLATVT